MYDPKFSVKQMYDNYGSSRSTPKTNANKQAADSMKSVGVRGIGSRPVTFPDRDDDRGSTYDVVPQVFRQPTPPPPKEKSTLEGIKEKAVSLFNLFGGDEPKEKETNFGNVYKGPMFRGPITPGAIETRIRDAVDYSKAPPIYYGGIPNEGNMRYDVVPPATANPNLQRNTINRIIKSLAPNSKEYKIKRGDTLSEIAQKEGLKVSDLVKINKIKDKHHIVEGETLIIPASQEVIKVMDLVDSVDPDAQFYQSGVPMEQRIFEPEPELGYDEIALPSEATVDKKIKGLGARPEVTVTELDPVIDPAQPQQFGQDPEGMDRIRFVSTPAIDNIYEEIGDSETTTSHLGASDYQNVGITLGYGIVPTSGLKYEHNGTVIELPDNEAERWATLSAAGVTAGRNGNFRPENVITDDVVKDGIRRDTYDSDESFTKAVMKKFQDRVETAAERQGVDADDIPEGAMTGLVGYSYNTGESHDYNDMEPVYEELTRGANANMTTVQNGMLQTFTTGGIVKQGMANRRRTDYNHVAEALGQPTITHKTNRRLANGNAGFEFEFSDGTTRTFDTGKRYASASVSEADFKRTLNVRQAVN